MQVEILIVNRKGLGSHVQTVDFVDMPTLRQTVNELVDEVPFHKVIVELSPDWEVSPEQQKELDAIETGN